MNSILNLPEEFEKRVYQEKAWKNMTRYFKDYLRNTLEPRWGKLDTAMLIHMATGSGKTFTVGKFINDIFAFRARFARVYPDVEVPPINALVLNDQIGLVDQLHVDFMEWRNDKPSLISDTYKPYIQSALYHSKADDIYENLRHSQIEYTDDEGDILQGVDTNGNGVDVEIIGNGSDTFKFSTFQTAYAKPELFADDAFNLIIIDEGHKLAGPTRQETLMRYCKPNEDWQFPLVVVMTATPDKILTLTGKPVVKFGLPEYLASPHSPQVSYELIVNDHITTQELDGVYRQLEAISQIEDINEKKRELREVKQMFEEDILANYNSNEELVTDLLQRVTELDDTIIFASNIADADAIVSLINARTWDPLSAVAMHSKIERDTYDILRDYEQWTHQVIVAVNQLNEGIDMPKTNNIVFWRNTDSPTIFQQQFGRWLRGKEVHVYDYVWGLRNLAWIENMNQEALQIYQKALEAEKDDTSSWKTERIDPNIIDVDTSVWVRQAGLSVGQLVGGGKSLSVDIKKVIDTFRVEEKGLDVTKEELIDWIKDQWDAQWWLWKTTKELEKLQYQWMGIARMKTLLWIDSSIKAPTHIRHEIVKMVFGVEKKEVTKEELVAWIKDQWDAQRWLWKTWEEVEKLQCQWMGIRAMRTLLWIDSSVRTSHKIRHEIVEMVFGVEKVTKEVLETWIKDQWDAQWWLWKTTKELDKLKYQWMGILAMRTPLWISSSIKQPLHIRDEIVEMVFGVEKVTKEVLETWIKDQWDAQWWLWKTTKELDKLKYQWMGIRAMRTPLWISGSIKQPTQIRDEIVEMVFGVEKKEVTKEELVDWIKDQWSARWLWKTWEEVEKLQYQWMGITAMKNILWIDGITRRRGQIRDEIVKMVFGVEKVTKEELVAWIKDQWDAQRWLWKTQKDLENLKYQWMGILAMRTLLWIDSSIQTLTKIRDEIVEMVFGVEKVTKEVLETWIKDQWDAQWWLWKTTKELDKLKYQWMGIVRMRTLLWIDSNIKSLIQIRDAIVEMVFGVTVKR